MICCYYCSTTTATTTVLLLLLLVRISYSTLRLYAPHLLSDIGPTTLDLAYSSWKPPSWLLSSTLYVTMHLHRIHPLIARLRHVPLECNGRKALSPIPPEWSWWLHPQFLRPLLNTVFKVLREHLSDASLTLERRWQEVVANFHALSPVVIDLWLFP